MSLFNLAFVRQQGGRFILRIEDTDRARFREDSEKQVFDTLRWLGLTWDEGPDVGGPCTPYRQSERLDTYQPYVDRLLAEGRAYRCWCSPERLATMREEQQRAKRPTGYDRLCLGRSEEERQALPGFSQTSVVRMLVPDDAPLEFDDLIRGRVSAPRPDDQVILKADGFPTYHLAVVVDDMRWGSPTSCAARSGSPPPPSTCSSTSGSESNRPASPTCPCCATRTSPRSPSAGTRLRGSPGSRSRATSRRLS